MSTQSQSEFKAIIFSNSSQFTLTKTYTSDPNWSLGQYVDLGLDQQFEVRKVDEHGRGITYKLMPVRA